MKQEKFDKLIELLHPMLVGDEFTREQAELIGHAIVPILVQARAFIPRNVTPEFCPCGNRIKQYPEGDDTMEFCEDCR